MSGKISQGDMLSPDMNDARLFSSTDSRAPLGMFDDMEATGADVDGANQRGNWSGKFDFLLSLLGYSVGLGNVWRFPYLAYSNGGGAFLIPFLLMLLLVGMPLMFMELAFGQYASLGPIAIFGKFCPLFSGLGYGMVIISGIVALYYNMIIAWTLFYMFASFTSELPWETCKPEWSTLDCYSYKDADACHKDYNETGIYYNRTCYNETMASTSTLDIQQLVINMTKRPPAEEYFENYVLSKSAGMHEMGGIKWQLALCLLLAWLIVFLCLSRGVQSSGKVVYFTALFPYVVLIILFFRGVTLPGAMNGIIYYLTPDFSRLYKAKVWGDAAVQIFFSLSPAWGGLITLASYNKYHNNCFKDTLIVAISNITTSIFAGFVIFSIVGYLAQELGKDVGDVVDQGAGLAFIVYPEVVTRLPISPLWSFLFFFMLLTLGLDSQFALLETVTTAALDRFPNWREKKTFVVLGMSCIGYIGGLMICTKGGIYMLQLMDTYAASWSVFLIAMLESIIIGWVYGAERFLGDIEDMIGRRSWIWHKFFVAFWQFLSPATLCFLLIFNWVQYKPIEYGTYEYPLWANLIGWLMALAPVVALPVMAGIKIYYAPKDMGFIQKLRHLLKPSADWGPAHKVAQYKECQDENNVEATHHNLEAKLSGNTFENPSFSAVYTFETKM
ncbi:sodium- and chloride-dependent glycine transporter 1-like isoform X2 [Lineus longissimus]|uniref:sodium- and chloride-dependent glycine transporter 1-like isoform X2 n=1 Tax=Lineus longissimus TaxID=88925 RepID=UPI00315DBDF0